jgi:ATP-dependent helicase/nuclease subunit A
MSERIDILAKNLMILASAGSGKTFQLGNRVIGLVAARDVDPERIVALTFTRKAAGEFADSVLTKLAGAAEEKGDADRLAAEIGVGGLDFPAVLGRVVRALPRLQLGTMDSFFARVVRAFQYELGLSGGAFALLEGPQLKAAQEDILSLLLGSLLEGGEADEFLHAFRRATMGKERQQVSELLQEFVKGWHGYWKSGMPESAWDGGAFPDLPEVETWESGKNQVAAALRAAVAGAEWSQPRQGDAVGKIIDSLESHTVGSGRLGESNTLFEQMIGQIAEGGDGLSFSYYKKEFTLPRAASRLFRDAVMLLARCELSAAVGRTRAVRDLLRRFDGECARRLRSKGLLGFDDVKALMGEWVRNEDARLRREAVDFRLDGRYDHWLLDEFQDTSPAEWTGVVPLLDEAAMRDDGTVFVVGDKKQAIYGWRGGDVRLFDDAARRYGSSPDGLKIQTMPDSWRSCGAVLELVNLVCGDQEAITALFGSESAARWPWEEHKTARPKLTGEARVELVEGDDEARMRRMVVLLKELGIGERKLTCGVLVRANKDVREVADRLRAEGFDVIEEGRRQPVEDNPVGVAMYHLVRWLADPADGFARELVDMSPLAEALRGRFGESWENCWERMLGDACGEGFAAVMESLVDSLWAGLSEFGRRRAGDVISALAEFDVSGGAGAREAVKWLDGLEVAQSPGVAAVQVMTIHKSKGLGFDVVVLPEVGGGQVADRRYFNIAHGVDQAGNPWLLQPPASWVRKLVPGLAEAEAGWERDQYYQAMCLLYVALTRAKRGLYVFMEPPGAKAVEEDRATLANWVARSIGGKDYQSGDPGWFLSADRRETAVAEDMPKLGAAVPYRVRTTPSGVKKESGAKGAHSVGGMRFGSDVHAVFEGVGWIDEKKPVLPAGEAGRLVGELLQVPAIRSLFERGGRMIECYREQQVEDMSDGKWLSGVVDRLHVHRGPDGRVESVDVIDFKTDEVSRAEELLERYAGQMDAYREVVRRVFGTDAVRCLLVATHARVVVEVEG